MIILSKKFTVIFALLFSLIAPGVLSTAFGQDILPARQVAQLLKRNDTVLIDVRNPDEWREGVIEGAHLLSLEDLRGSRKNWHPFLRSNKRKVFVLYCGSGKRAAIVQRILRSEGYQAVNAGGFVSLKRSGFRTVRPKLIDNKTYSSQKPFIPQSQKSPYKSNSRSHFR